MTPLGLGGVILLPSQPLSQQRIQHEATADVKQNTKLVLITALANAVTTKTAYETAVTARTALVVALNAADENVKAFISIARAVLLYFIALTAGYLALFVSAAVGIVRVERDLEGNSPDSVASRGRAVLPISILVPAHNEEKTVVESVRALLKLRYPQLEVVVVNDGSKDHTMARLKSAFALDEVPLDIRMELACKPIRATYRSAVHRQLIVVDKANGGKADALNCAINAARYPLVCAIDADTLILPDALLRLVRPFLTDVDVVAVGGTICLANGCTDRTPEVAREFAANLAEHVSFRVVELPEPGKSRTWNRFVHELSDPNTDYLILMDADIVF
jgi:cellulose synthase/poly-beta-1,6-N-acetylglucosamine synthase-like glycosyltransferase